MTLMQAIARQEGFQLPGSRAERNNNPGNLNYEPWMAQRYSAALETIPPGYKEAPRFACFPTGMDGWDAMRELLRLDYAGLTIREALRKWAPAGDGNDVSSYEKNVCQGTGMTPETVLTTENIG